MPLLPPPKPQVITRSKSAVIEHLRDAAPDKIDVLLNVTNSTLPQATALLRKLTAKNNEDQAMLIIVTATAA